MCEILLNDLNENAEYTLAVFHAGAYWIKIFLHIVGIDRYVWANIHYYIELYQNKQSLAILIRTLCFGSRINFFLNKKLLIASEVYLRN